MLSSSRLPLRLVSAVINWKAELFGTSQSEKFSSSQHQLNANSRKYISQVQRVSLAESQKQSLSGPDSVVGEDSQAILKKFYEKTSSRKHHTRGMLRAKSVEFNFNSSSTDASVFDYEKALSGVPDMDVPDETFHQMRKAGVPGKTFTGGLRVPTEKSLRKPRRGERMTRSVLVSSDLPKGRLKDEDIVSDPSEMVSIENHTQRHASEQNADENENNNFEGFSHNLTPGRTSSIKYREEKESDIKTDPDPNALSGERFVRLNLTPRTKRSARNVFNYGSGDTERESGIDGSDLLPNSDQDPYDNVIKEIRDISSSSLSNMEKLQKVCGLLSVTAPVDVEQKRPKFGSHLSQSTMDLRPNHSHSHPLSMHHSRKHYFGRDQMIEERPVEVVQRMKRNLAKSMENLGSLVSPLDENSFSSGDHERVKDTVRDRFMAECNFQLKSEENGLKRNWSVSTNCLNKQYEPHQTANFLSEKTNKSTRPSSLNIFSHRNFISPSFLRPASSMKDVSMSSGGHHPLTLELLHEIDLEAEYQTLQALEDLDSNLKAYDDEVVSSQKNLDSFCISHESNKDENVFSQILNGSESKTENLHQVTDGDKDEICLSADVNDENRNSKQSGTIDKTDMPVAQATDVNSNSPGPADDHCGNDGEDDDMQAVQNLCLPDADVDLDR